MGKFEAAPSNPVADLALCDTVINGLFLHILLSLSDAGLGHVTFF